MSSKRQFSRDSKLKQRLEQANLAERQAKDMALMKSDEDARVAAYTEERDLANQLLGQVQMAGTISKLLTVVTLSKLKTIKEKQLYQGLKGKSAVDLAGEKIADVGTWEGFCRALGFSRQKVDEDLSNLSAFGENALQSMNQLGVGYRELRKLRQLPEAERELIINGEAVQSGDKDALVELIEDMAVRHAREKEDLENSNRKLRDDLASKENFVKKKIAQITQLERQLDRITSLPEDERARELSRQLDKAVSDVKAALLKPEAVINRVLNELQDAPRDLVQACAQSVARLRICLDDLQARYGLPSADLDVDDSWMRAED